jgi:serine protease Do
MDFSRLAGSLTAWRFEGVLRVGRCSQRAHPAGVLKLIIMQRCSADPQRLSHVTRLVLGGIVAIVGMSSRGRAQDPAAALEETLVRIVEQAEPAVVSIARFKPSPEDARPSRHRVFAPIERQPRDVDLLPNEFGAGCLISPPNSSDRLVLTNFHVVRGGPVFPGFSTEDETELRIQFSDRRGCRGAIIAADPRSDLAVLRLEWDEAGIKATDFRPLGWETGSAPRKGQLVVLLGNPHAIARDGSASVSWGLISNLTRQPASLNRNQSQDPEDSTSSSMLYRLGAVMQLDARLNLGTSGGPVLNLKGELIGVSTSLAAIEGYEQSAGFALPIDLLTRRIIRTLLLGQEVEYGMLGVVPQQLNPEDFLRLNTELSQRSAAMVAMVTRGSPADIAGMIPGDVIVKVEDGTVRSIADLMRMVGMHPPDSEIDITFWRSRANRPGKLETARIKLGKWPVKDDEGIIETSPRYAPWRGLSVDYPTARDRFIDRSPDIRASPDLRRVLVTKVIAGSPADIARLQPGDFFTHVNNVSVQTPAEFQAAIKSVTGSVTIKLLGDPRADSMELRQGRVVIVRE